MLFSSALLAWLAFGGMTITFLVEMIVNSLELAHLSKAPLSRYKRTTDYILHEYKLDSFRVKIFNLVLNYVFYVVFLASMGKIWSFTKRSSLFLVVSFVLELIFVTLPEESITKCFVGNKYGLGTGFSEVLVSVLSSGLDDIIGQFLILGILYLVARCTHLDPVSPQTDTTPQDNQNRTEEQPQRRRSCHGKFAAVLTVVAIAVLVAVNLSMVEIFEAVSGKQNFQRLSESSFPMRNETSADFKAAVKELVDLNGFPYQDVYLFTTSQSPNAVFMGITKKRIVIFTSLLRYVNARQLCAVVGHELGHWKNKDSVRMLFWVLFLIIFAGCVVKLITMLGLDAFGFPDGRKPVIVVVILAEVIFMSFAWVGRPLTTLLSRNHEYAADCFIAKQGYPIAEALRSITTSTANEIEYTWLYEVFYLDHPQLSKREQNAAKCAK